MSCQICVEYTCISFSICEYEQEKIWYGAKQTVFCVSRPQSMADERFMADQKRFCCTAPSAGMQMHLLQAHQSFPESGKLLICCTAPAKSPSDAMQISIPVESLPAWLLDMGQTRQALTALTERIALMQDLQQTHCTAGKHCAHERWVAEQKTLTALGLGFRVRVVNPKP